MLIRKFDSTSIRLYDFFTPFYISSALYDRLHSRLSTPSTIICEILTSATISQYHSPTHALTANRHEHNPPFILAARYISHRILHSRISHRWPPHLLRHLSLKRHANDLSKSHDHSHRFPLRSMDNDTSLPPCLRSHTFWKDPYTHRTFLFRPN
jgi:hypothetical protein